MRRAVLAAVVSLVALAAGPARAVEPGWNPLLDLAPGGPDEAVRSQPLPGGEFLVLNSSYVAGRQYSSYDLAVSDVRPDGSSSMQALGSTDYNAADLATSSDGDARVVWPFYSEATGSHLYSSLRPAGGPQFGPQTDLGVQAQGRPRVAMNSSGASVVVADEAGTLVAVFIPRGGQPSAPVTIATPPASTPESNTYISGAWVTLGDDGRAVVVWVEQQSDMTCTTDANGNQICQGTGSHNSLHWSSGTAAGFDQPATIAAVGDYPMVWMASDRGGGTAVAWRSGDQNQVAMSLRPAGGAFGPVRDLGNAYRVSLADTPAGQLLVAYPRQRPDNNGADATMILGNTRDGTLGSAITGDEGAVALAGAGWSEERVVVWSTSTATRATWFDANGNRSPTRNVNCGSSAGPFAAMVSDGHALALFDTFSGTEARIAAAIARPETPPSDLACASPTPPGVIVNPAPPLIDYSAYNNGTRKATALMSPPAPNGQVSMPSTWSDGGSDDPAFSQDNRNARLFAFDSAATNLVARDRNRHRDVFVVRRARGGGNLWGTISDATRGANGDSSHPSLDGATGVDPHCVAFQSTATNLDRRDRSRDVDVYVRDLHSGRTRLVSIGLPDASHPVVDGRCSRVTFQSRGSVWVAPVRGGMPLRLAHGTQPDQQTNGRGAAYVRGHQVWYRSFLLRGRHLARGRERLVSANPAGHPGNGASAHPALDDVGAYVAFDSTATDLCGSVCVNVKGDVNGSISDVFRRTLSRRAPTHDRMELVSLDQFAASHDPVISAAGENVLFESDAVRRLPDGTIRGGLDPNQRRVFTWEFPRGRMTGATRLIVRQCRQYQCAQASTREPAMSSRGNYIAFAAQESEFCPPYNAFPVKGGRSDCAPFTDVFAQYVGPSHEGKPLG